MVEDQDLWEIAFGKLDDDTVKLLKSSANAVPGGVTALIALIEDTKQKKMANEAKNTGWNITIPGPSRRDPKILNLRNMVYKIMEAALEFKYIVTKMLVLDPTQYGALAWSLVSFGMNMALNGKQHYELAWHGATFLAEELRKYAAICAQYRKKSMCGREQLRERIVDAYIALLQYGAELKRLGNQGFLGRSKQNLSSTSTLDPLRKVVDDIDVQVQGCISRVATETLDADMVEVKHKLQTLKKLAIESKNLRSEVLNWAYPSEETGHAAMRNRLQDDLKEDAGHWLLERREFHEWENEEGASGLRIEGEVGTGKTILTSTVFEHISAKYSSAGEIGVPTAVFYCSGVRDSYGSSATDPTESGASGANDILRSILRQFGQSTEGLQMLKEEYKSRPRNRRALQLSDTKRLLRKLVEMHTRSYIVLDALDECVITGQDAKRLNVMEIFNELLRIDVSVKIFVSSRFESDIQERMKAWNAIPVTPVATRFDLDAFIDRTIDRELQDKEDCDDNDKSELKRKLKAKAQGNFRWTQISLEYICEPNRSGFDLLSVLDSIPPELDDFYFNLLCKVKDDNCPWNRILGIRAIKYLLILTRPRSSVVLTTKKFLSAVCSNTAYENRPITVRHIRIACHHLVAWDGISDSFNFGHFSVAEFFNMDSSKDSHSSEIRLQFKTESLWQMVIEDVLAGTRLLRGHENFPITLSTHVVLMWSLFSDISKTSMSNQSTGIQYVPRTAPEQRVKIAVLADGLYRPLYDSGSPIHGGACFVHDDGSPCEAWYHTGDQTRSRRFNGTHIIMNIHHAEPDCNFYIAKVCVDLEPQGSPVENVLKAVLWAVNMEVDIITISTPIHIMAGQLLAALEKAKESDTVVIYNAHDSSDNKSSTPSTASGPRDTTAYYFPGNECVEEILRCIGNPAQTSAAIIGSTIISGLAAVALEHHYRDAKNGHPKSRRQYVREVFDKMADEGMAGNEKMPWSLVKDTGGEQDKGGSRLRAMLY